MRICVALVALVASAAGPSDRGEFRRLIAQSGTKHLAGDIDGARKLTAAAVDLARAQEWSEELTYALNNAGILATHAGAYADARASFLEAERRSVGPLESAAHLRAMAGLVEVFVRSGRRSEAWEWYSRGVAAAKSPAIADLPEIAPALVDLAHYPFEGRQSRAAEQLYAAAIRLADRYTAAKPYFLIQALDGLGHIQLEAGRNFEAASTLERAWRTSTTIHGAVHPQTLNIAAKLAIAWARNGRVAEAAALARESSRTLEQSADPLDLAHALLGEAYIAVENHTYDFAASLAAQAVVRLVTFYGPDHDQVIAAKRQAATLYAMMKRKREARRLESEADAAEQLLLSKRSLRP